MKTIRVAMTLLLAAGLAGCGMATPGQTSGSLVASSPSADISKAESLEIVSLNDSGALDDLDDDMLTDIDDTESTDSSLTTQGLFKGSTRIGYIRSTEDGKFFLQAKQGIWKSKQVSFALSGSEAISLAFAKDLNDKVLVRGSTSGTSMTIKSIHRIPNLAVIVNLLRTGCVSGKIYNGKTLASLADAAVTLRSVDTGRIFRTSSHDSGKFHVGLLQPGDYTVESTLGGFSKGTLAKVTVKKLKSVAANVPMSPSASLDTTSP